MEEEELFEHFLSATMICCVPSICHVGEPILAQNLFSAVKVICNNESCHEGQYMHKICFEEWEYTVLTYLRSTGRARSWSEKQRLQNLWTKKGYDLAYKACNCKCGKGHLRKDLDWIPPLPPLDYQTKKKKHRKKKNDKPTLSIAGNAAVSRHSIATGQQVPINRIRSSSMSSMSSTSGSPPNFAFENPDLENYVRSTALKVTSGVENSSVPLAGKIHGQRVPTFNYNIFSRRQDYSSFNSLPRNKINSYHIKTDTEDFCDEKDFIFPTLYARKILGVNCIFCSSHMIVYDRCPLIDGTFFISPLKYSDASIPMLALAAVEQYLNAICMACLEGWTTIICKFCYTKWHGNDLILGTLYLYDVIAARPCCEERLQCNRCEQLLPPPYGMKYFSEYSRRFVCNNCNAVDFHYIKKLSTFLVKSNSR